MVETKIIAFSGRKQSGKNTCSNFLHGSVLMDIGHINAFDINDKGQLEVPAKDEDGTVIGVGILDLESSDPKVIQWLELEVWPFIKGYSFAYLLKQHICVNILGLT